jgi:large subunit ribosomal protein L18
MEKNIVKTERRNKVRRRIRSSITGTAERPRLCVYKSNKKIYAQVIDDQTGTTLASSSALSGIDGAKQAGTEVAKAATEKGINKVVFDRSGYRYHGRVKALAEGAREGGLDF